MAAVSLLLVAVFRIFDKDTLAAVTKIRSRGASYLSPKKYHDKQIKQIKLITMQRLAETTRILVTDI